MNFLTSIWRVLNLLSLDVVFGAMAGMLFFADLLDVSLPFVLYVVLGMAVWGIYTLDHLIDAKRIVHLASSDRHRFHQKHFVSLCIILAIVVLSGFGLMICFESLHFIFFPGVIFAGGMVLWMGFLQFFEKKLAWLKEISTAVFYAIGISLAPFFSVFPNEVPVEFFLILIAYILLAGINLFMLSYIDEKSDAQDKLGSALLLMSKIVLRRFILLLSMGAIIYLVGVFILVPSYYRIHVSVLLLLVLFHVFEFNRENGQNIRERLEASFLLPLVLLVL
ncbi:hypothetical protein [Cecembia calidifontis]|uniref:UbiA prenyltransferase family protein n=1 Tax=Cecembia calidifontis TaxID=1187080 RepID=A0A4Q7P4U3_9BACT|nr:hypothetical protein [Cecembia calidifontis]RZS95016.1 hypothetical protein BC751_0531 [Cecembia calidifontis]